MGHDPPEDTERRYQRLIETSPAPINLFDRTGETLWGNDAVVELLDLDSREELIGRSIFEFIRPADRYTAEQELKAVVEEKIATGPTRMDLQTADGVTKNIRVSTAPGRYGGQDIGQAVVIDITPLNEAQAALEAEQRFIESTLDTLQDVFYVINLAGELIRWNDSLLDVSGYREQEVRTMGLEDFFVDQDVPRISASIATALAEGEDVIEATLVTKHGNEIPYEFRKRRLEGEDGIAGLAGIGRDISEQRARDQYLKNIDKLLHHSLRNQLNIIQGHIQLLQNECECPGGTHIDAIEQATEKLQSTFEKHHHITDFVTTQPPASLVDVVPIIERILETIRETYPSVEITSELPDEATVRAVRGIEQAFEEVVTNAIVHNDHSDPLVDVLVEERDATTMVQIIDNGPSISEMDRKVVTGENTARSTYHSEGLGLWFVSWIVTRSKGTLSFSTNQPRGNVVTIELSQTNPHDDSVETLSR